MANEPKLDDILSDILNQLSVHLEGALPSVRQAIFSSGRQFVASSREEMIRWTELASTGVLETEDIEFLVKSKVDLMELKALEQMGLSKVRLDELRASLTSSILGGILKAAGL